MSRPLVTSLQYYLLAFSESTDVSLLGFFDLLCCWTKCPQRPFPSEVYIMAMLGFIVPRSFGITMPTYKILFFLQNSIMRWRNKYG